MELIISHHKYHHEIENLTRVFLPFEKLTITESEEMKAQEDDRIFAYEESGDNLGLVFDISYHGEKKKLKTELSRDASDDECEKAMATLLFEALSDILEYRPAWGLLTGVRPSKLMTMKTAELGREKAVSYFEDKMLVTHEKTALALDVADRENAIIKTSKPRDFSLYVSIPFCPTRCSYCSFVSHSVEMTHKMIPEYVDKLCEEIRITAETAKAAGLRLSTIYFGGGTPTTLSHTQLDKIQTAIEENFDLSYLSEYTVEAGRPDTVTAEKLRTLKKHGVTRISINPQTFHDEILENIGRKHTTAQTEEAFALARSLGFDNINMDLIAGLPGDTVEGFMQSVDRAVELSPENITVHTLCLKRASALVSQKQINKETGDTAVMLDYAYEILRRNGYAPYYMYRQTRQVGNMENTGWCKEGRECLYNIFMMEEIHSVLAVGAGGVTKLRHPFEYDIKRCFNFKYPYEYTARFDELIKRKTEITDYYGGIDFGN